MHAQTHHPRLAAMSVPHACRPSPTLYRKAFNLIMVRGREEKVEQGEDLKWGLGRGGEWVRKSLDYCWLKGISNSRAQKQINTKAEQRMAAGNISPLQQSGLSGIERILKISFWRYGPGLGHLAVPLWLDLQTTVFPFESFVQIHLEHITNTPITNTALLLK